MNSLVNTRMEACLRRSYSLVNAFPMDETETKAKLIADALDRAMQNYKNGKPISQAALSRISGVPQPTISRTLKGKSTPETDTIAKLASALGGAFVFESMPNLAGVHFDGSSQRESHHSVDLPTDEISKVLRLPEPKDALMDELVTIADRLTERGKIELIGMAKALCATHNKLTSINAQSSQ